MAVYSPILTNAGAAKIAAARVSGTEITYAYLAVGDANGVSYTPTAMQTELVHELWRDEVESVYVHANFPNQVVCEARIPITDGGFDIREAGVFLADGTMLAVSRYPTTTKPLPGSGSDKDLLVRFIFEVTNAAEVTHIIEHSLIYATKEYVDSRLHHVRLATTANISLSGTQTIDGVSAVVGDRVLVRSQIDGTTNGIYIVKAGAWTRALDFNTNENIIPMALVCVSEGTTYKDNIFKLTNDSIVLGTTSLVFAPLSELARLSGAFGNLAAPIFHMPLKNSLMIERGVGDVTFTRDSTATYRDRYGVLKYVAIDTPRFNSNGLIIESSSTNMLTYSEQIDHAGWGKVRCSVLANATTAPDGTTTADKIVEDTSETQNHYISQVVSATDGWLSIFAKAGERTRVQLRAAGGANQRAAGFDLSNGTIFNETQSGTTQTSAAHIEAFVNGWYRCSILANGADNTAVQIAVDNGTSHSYTGDGTSGLYIWGAQWESDRLTSYIPTTDASATRAYESCGFTSTENTPAYDSNFTIIVDYGMHEDSDDQFFSFDILGCDTPYILYPANGIIHMIYRNVYLESTTTYLPGTKPRITFVKDGVYIKLYVNGILEASGTLESNSYYEGSYCPYLTSLNDDIQPLYDGLSNLRIYDFAMTAEEVRLA